MLTLNVVACLQVKGNLVGTNLILCLQEYCMSHIILLGNNILFKVINTVHFEVNFKFTITALLISF